MGNPRTRAPKATAKTKAKAKAKVKRDETEVDRIDRELDEERQRLAAKDAKLEHRWGPAVEPIALIGLLAAVAMGFAQLNSATGLAVALFSTAFNAVAAYARARAPKAAERAGWVLKWPGLLLAISALILLIRLAVVYRH